MRPTLSLTRREFAAYFLSPIAYVVLFCFLLITGALFFWTSQLLIAQGPRGIEYPMRGMLGNPGFWLIFVAIPALLTMRSFAEERAAGTLEMLMTAPIRDWQIVLSKFLACFGFYLLLWVPTLIYLPVLLDMSAGWNPGAGSIFAMVSVAGVLIMGLTLLLWLFVPLGWFGSVLFLLGLILMIVGEWQLASSGRPHLIGVSYGIDPYPALTTYLGIILVGAMFLSIGLFFSTMVKSQLVAAIIALIPSLAFIAPGFIYPYLDSSGLPAQIVAYVSVPLHFENEFTRGIFDVRRAVLYVSVTLLALFLTVMSLHSRRWK